jgi:hypothetical protein
MKFVRTLLYFGLGISILLNFLLYMRNEKMRSQFRVNGHNVTKREYHDWLEQRYGLETQKQIIQYYLIQDAAKKAGVWPTDAEVAKQVVEQEEVNPEVASQMKIKPWIRVDVERAVQQRDALFNLATKDVKVTDDQLKSVYNAYGSTYFDEPAKIYTRMIGSADQGQQRQDYLKRAKELLDSMAQRAKLEQPTPGTQQKVLADIQLIHQQLQPHVGLFYGDGRKAFRSGEPAFAALDKLKVGESTILPDNKLGPVLVYVEKRVEGRKTSLAEPETKKKVERLVKQSQQVNAQEMMRKLWDEGNIQTDPEGAKSDIERMIVPERAQQQQTASR